MRRLDLIICCAFIAVALQVASADAFDMPARGKWWQDEQIVSTLNLSREQSRQIDDIFKSHRKEFLEFSARLKKNYIMLENYLESAANTDIDPQRLSMLVDEVHKARAQLETSRLIMLLEVRKVLSKQQTDLLKQMQGEMKRHMEGMGGKSGRGMGMHRR